jgi:hypothetical protein
MKDEEFADEVIRRLNELIATGEGARLGVEAVCNTRTWVFSDELKQHPTIQVGEFGIFADVGMLGILNGITGAIEGGDRNGCGFIASVYDEGKLVGFRRLEEMAKA